MRRRVTRTMLTPGGPRAKGRVPGTRCVRSPSEGTLSRNSCLPDSIPYARGSRVRYHAAHARGGEFRCATSWCRLWERAGADPESAARQVARRLRFHHDRLGQVRQQLQRPIGRRHRAFPTGM
jgi:hypothetical protein